MYKTNRCNITYGGRALVKTLCLLRMTIFNRKMAKQTCGSRTEAMQNNNNILNSLTIVVHKNKRDATDNSDKVEHPCAKPSHVLRS